MKTIISKIRKIQSIIKENRKNKYISYKNFFINIYKNRKTKYQIHNIDFYKKQRNCDTVFLLGNGPSLNLLNDSHITAIHNAHSFGIANSFLKKEIVPTYQLFSWENDHISLNIKSRNFAKYRKAFKNTVMMLNSKALFRFSHPVLTPFMFPVDPKCMFFWDRKAISIHEERPFLDSDFDESLVYRGTLSLALDLVNQLEYKNIVLLGVDLDKWEYFYQNMPEMQEALQKTYQLAHGVKDVKEAKDKNMQYVGMYARDGKPHTLNVYLLALKDYLKRKRDCNLYVGLKSNSLHPDIPAFFEE